MESRGASVVTVRVQTAAATGATIGQLDTASADGGRLVAVTIFWGSTSVAARTIVSATDKVAAVGCSREVVTQAMGSEAASPI